MYYKFNCYFLFIFFFLPFIEQIAVNRPGAPITNSAILPGMLNPMAPRKDIPMSDSAGECFVGIFNYSLLYLTSARIYTQGIVASPSLAAGEQDLGAQRRAHKKIASVL